MSATDNVFMQLLRQLEYDPQSPMIFNSGFFLWFFLVFISGYVLLKGKTNLRLLYVILCSYYFYYKSSGTYFVLLALVTCCDFFLAQQMARTHSVRQRKLLVTVSLVVNLGLLCFFKYTNFFGETIASLTGGDFTPLNIFLPIGISFFTFQSLSYTIDVYRNRIQPLTRLQDYAFYVSFFPQLVAGPIVRAREFIPQIRRTPLVTQPMLGTGVYLIAAGLFKKAVISDYISINFVERIFANPQLYSGLENLLGIYGYALQIYCDFSGYSDMAIGLALLLGFHFNINFDSPYQSASITEFWSRWHISLSSWLKDYLYISLGGNRRGKIRQYINLMLTMLLGGLWHGASWNFVIWGMLHGAGLVVHKLYMQLGLGKEKAQGWRHVLCVVLTFHFVCFCWIFFRHKETGMAIDMLHRIFSDFHAGLLPQLFSGYREVFLLMGVGYLLHFAPSWCEDKAKRFIISLPLAGKALLLAAVIFLVIQVKSSEIQPFIYFQF